MFASIRNTGARINEVLASPAMIFAAAALPVCAAGHAETALVKAARSAGTVPHRLVPLSEQLYLSQLQMMVPTLKKV
jgi:hypothetical protein